MSARPRTLLAFDYGSECIGVAVGQELTRTAGPLVTLRTVLGKPDWATISALVAEWHPDAFVVGMPLNMDSTDNEITPAVRRFGNQLRGRYNLPVYWMDERLTSVEAERALRASSLPRRKRLHKETVDQMAAQIILESWMAQS